MCYVSVCVCVYTFFFFFLSFFLSGPRPLLKNFVFVCLFVGSSLGRRVLLIFYL